jgi:heme exporter protein C
VASETGSAASASGAPFARLIRLRQPLFVAAAVALLALTMLALLWAPTLSLGFSAPVAQRIFYLHIGAAVASYAAFTVAFIASVRVLQRVPRAALADRLASECAGIGLTMAAITIGAGSLWAWAEWGTPWRLEDERLMTYLVLFFVYIGYLVLRARMPQGEARARTSAIYAIAGFALVPFSYFSIYIWRTLHPTVISPGGQGIGPQGALVLFVSMAAYLLLFVAFLAWRLDLLALADRLGAVQRRADP